MDGGAAAQVWRTCAVREEILQEMEYKELLRMMQTSKEGFRVGVAHMYRETDRHTLNYVRSRAGAYRYSRVYAPHVARLKMSRGNLFRDEEDFVSTITALPRLDAVFIIYDGGDRRTIRIDGAGAMTMHMRVVRRISEYTEPCFVLGSLLVDAQRAFGYIPPDLGFLVDIDARVIPVEFDDERYPNYAGSLAVWFDPDNAPQEKLETRSLTFGYIENVGQVVRLLELADLAPRLSQLSFDVVADTPESLADGLPALMPYTKAIKVGLTKIFRATAPSSRSGDNIEDSCPILYVLQRDHIRGFERVQLTVDMEHYIDGNDDTHVMQLARSPDRPRWWPWTDDGYDHTCREFVLQFGGTPPRTPCFPKLAKVILHLVGPNCEVCFSANGQRVSNPLWMWNEALRAEINAIVYRTRASRAPGWSKIAP